MAPNLFNTLPPELILKICDSVEAEDYLCLKLSCKSFGPYMTKSLSMVITERPSSYAPVDNRAAHGTYSYSPYYSPRNGPIPKQKQRYMFIMARTEVLIVRDKGHSSVRNKRVLPRLLCTECGKVKDANEYVDVDSASNIFYQDLDRARHCLDNYESRRCIPCQENGYRGIPSKRASVVIDRKKHFVCAVCKQPHLMDKGVHLRDGYQKACVPCADEAGLGYTKAKKGAPCRFVVHDEWTDVKELADEYRKGNIDAVAASSKYKRVTKGSRISNLRAAKATATAKAMVTKNTMGVDDEEGGEIEGEEVEGEEEGDEDEEEEEEDEE